MRVLRNCNSVWRSCHDHQEPSPCGRDIGPTRIARKRHRFTGSLKNERNKTLVRQCANATGIRFDINRRCCKARRLQKRAALF